MKGEMHRDMSSDDDRPLVSVVTPFYNTDEYLEECIESILAQSYSNWEYVLVNNCSDDKSRDIASRFAKSDERILLVDNEGFLGQVDNYNESLRHISPDSKYCKIVQADDWIFRECIERMVEIGEEHPSTVIIGAYGMFGDHVYLTGLPYPSHCSPGSVPCRKLLMDRTYVFGSPTSIMFRSDLVRNRNPFFSIDSPVEDAEICFDLLRNGDFGFVHQVLTFTRTENDSITKGWQTYNPMLLTELLCCRKFGKDYLTEHEYAARMRSLESEYWRFLGESVLRRRDEDFWDFHRSGMLSIGESFVGRRKVGYALLALADLLLNPKLTIERLVSFSKRRQ
jgi:glycosyltransferase involved in cell wall biosynthesis